MKIIDLLNKIANGEELPEKIKIYEEILRLNENKNNYLYEDSDEYYGDEFIHWFNLNDEVEIIEETEENLLIIDKDEKGRLLINNMAVLDTQISIMATKINLLYKMIKELKKGE